MSVTLELLTSLSSVLSFFSGCCIWSLLKQSVWIWHQAWGT